MKRLLSSSISWQLGVTVLLLVTTLTASKLTARRRSDSLAQPLDTIPKVISGFLGVDAPDLGPGTLATLRCDSYLSRLYRKPGIDADVFIAYYAQQRSGESMHSPKHCLPGAGWEIWDYANTVVPVGNRRFTVNKYSISHDTTRRVVLYWYQSKTRIIASEYLGKILLARDALFQNSTAGSLVRIIVPDQPGAVDEARAFASGLIPQVERCFGR
ncbi:MAG TPA: EpsI family protein [Bryobacteraceae bacterium]|nr:EpsI family protein [Bryobacteraceae bacterium]